MKIITCALVMTLGACAATSSETVPTGQVIDAVEQKLSAHPCIGDLDQWERNYRFAKAGGLSAYTAQADVDVIEFHLRRAGVTTITPGRNVLRRAGVDDWPDGKSIRYIDGRYRLHDQRLSMPACAVRTP
jgi:hypothetical protein